MICQNDNTELFEKRLAYFGREFALTGMDIIPANLLRYCARYSIHAEKKGLLLHSGTGTGKTARMNFIAEKFGIKLIFSSTFFDAYKSSGAEFAAELALVTLKNRLDRYSDFSEDLIIDDLGSEPPSANCFGTVVYPLAEIIEQRYIMFSRHGALTHVTSNKTLAQIKEIYGDRVFSRIHEMCYHVNMSGRDRRLPKE